MFVRGPSTAGFERQVTEIQARFWRIITTVQAELKAYQQILLRAESTLPRLYRSSLEVARKQMIISAKQIVSEQALLQKQATESLFSIEQSIKRVDPSTNLKLGYSLVYTEGKLLRSVATLVPGEIIEVRVADGSFISDIKKVL